MLDIHSQRSSLCFECYFSGKRSRKNSTVFCGVGVKIRVVITVQLSEEGVLTARKLGVKSQKL